MKHFVSQIIFLFLLMSCSVTNRIVVTDDSQMKTLKLAQTPEAIIVKDTLSGSTDLEVTSIYLCEEVKNIRPQVTVSFQIKKPVDEQLSAASIVIKLDNENVELYSLNYASRLVNDSLTLVNTKDTVNQNEPIPTDTTINSRSGKGKQSYIIPENLWVSIIHANIVKYRIIDVDDQIELVLNQSQKSMLDKFLGMAIKDRNAIFPAIPEGQKKW